MFGNVIYYDKRKINEYKSIISGQRNLEVNEYEVCNDKGVQLGLKGFGADAKASKTFKAKVQESLLLNCDEFEKMLEGRDDFWDFTQSSEFDISTIRRGNIIKFEGFIAVPEKFDLTQTIDRFKPMILESLTNQGSDKSEQEAMKLFFDTPNAKVPILIDFEEEIMCSKLVSDNMLIRYEELEEYDELEVTIIARITTNNMINKNKPFYDPLKDFLSLNRTMRRGMEGRTDGLYEIYAERDYRTIEVLAIYQ